jgi:plasmid stability protein
MPQLLVRDLEPAVVNKLRRRAAELGVSMEETHRRLLRSALAGDHPGPQKDFLAYLCSIPPGGGSEFPRAADRPRRIEF